MAWSPTLALRSWMKPSRWSGSRDWSPACMAARASSRHSARRPVVTPSSRLSASRVSPRRSRRTTSVLRRLDHRPLSCRSPSAAPLARSRCRRRVLVSWLLHGSVHWVLESQMGVSGHRAADHQPRSCWALPSSPWLGRIGRIGADNVPGISKSFSVALIEAEPGAPWSLGNECLLGDNR